MNHLIGAHVHANGIRQHYLRYGLSGTPVVLVPGITSPAITWGFVAEELAYDFDVHVLDVRGRGLSEAGPHLDYDIDACADDVIAFTRALDLEDAILLGHSMGARHAIRAARRAPGLFSRLVLIDPPMSGPGRRPYPAAIAWYLDSIALARRGATGEDLRPFSPSWTDAERALRAEWLHTCDERAVLASYDGFHSDDIHGDLPALHAPALLMGAAKGDVVTDMDAAECMTLAPSMQFVRVEDAGHMIPWDNLPGFLAPIRAFLAAR